jgi:hypothetical protein
LARRFTPNQAAGIIERQDFKIIFQYHPLVPPGKDKSPYRKLSQDFVRIETFGLQEFIRVEGESLRLPAEQGDERLYVLSGGASHAGSRRGVFPAGPSCANTFAWRKK